MKQNIKKLYTTRLIKKKKKKKKKNSKKIRFKKIYQIATIK